MNKGGAIAATPAMDRVVSTHGNHDGNAVLSRSHPASQKGIMAAMYPPIRDLAASAARCCHLPSVSSSLRNIALPTLQSSRTTAGTASAKRDKTTRARPLIPNENTKKESPLRRA